MDQNTLKFRSIDKFVYNDNRCAKLEHKVEQSKESVKNVRFEPDDVEAIKDLCFDRNITFSDFIRKSSDLGKVFIDHADTLIKDKDVWIHLLENSEIVALLVRSLTKKI